MLKQKKLLLALIPVSIFLFSCGNTGENGENEENEYSEGGEYISGLHYQGLACSKCHSQSTAKEQEYVFNTGGTIFKNLSIQDNDAGNASLNHTVRITTQSGKSFTLSKGRGTGNFWGNLSINESFKAEVLDGNGKVVNQTAGYTHDASRLDCNKCHTSTGLNGAPGRIVSYMYQNNTSNNTQPTGTVSVSLTANPTSGNAPLTVNFVCSASSSNGIKEYQFDFDGNGTVDTTNTSGVASFTYQNNGSYTAKCTAIDNQNNTGYKTVNISVGNTSSNTQTLTFTNDISPILNTKCSSCHNANNASGGLNVGDYTSVKSRVDVNNPSGSLLLQKATKAVSHGGGQILTTTSPEYQTILNWIQQGANQ